MADYQREELHSGGLVEVGTGREDPASLAMGFEDTSLSRLCEPAEQRGAPPRLVAFELSFTNEDDTPLTGDLYAVYRVNNPLLKALGAILFAGPVELVDDSGPVVLRSVGEADVVGLK